MRFVFIATLLVTHMGLAMERASFAIPSADKKATLTGEIDFPMGKTSGPMPAIVLVGGTGLFDRDYYFGNSGTDADFLFRTLAEKGAQNNYAVVRFDYRGIRCNRRTAPPCSKCKSDLEKRQSYVQYCIDNKLRSSVTPKTIRDDILSVYNYALRNPAIDSEKVIVFAHSEGTIHVSYLVNQKRINPRGLLFMGAVGESSQSIIEWQSTDIHGKVANLIWWPMDLNKDSIISNGEIDNTCKNIGLPAVACASLQSPEGGWTADTLKVKLNQDYQETAQNALKQKNRAPFLSENADAGAVFASYAWWKMFFIDTTEIASLLTNYGGRLSVNNGDIDISAPGLREISYFKKYASSWNRRAHLNVIKGRGHSLGSNVQIGPIPEDSLNHLIKEADWLIQ